MCKRPDYATTPLCHFATLSICRICTLMIYNNNILYYYYNYIILHSPAIPCTFATSLRLRLSESRVMLELCRTGASSRANTLNVAKWQSGEVAEFYSICRFPFLCCEKFASATLPHCHFATLRRKLTSVTPSNPLGATTPTEAMDIG